MANYPSPYGLRWLTVVDGLAHKNELLISVIGTPAVGTGFTSVSVNTRAGGTSDLGTFVATFMAAFRAVYQSGTAIQNIELWKYEPNSYDSSFVSAFPTSYSGSAAGSNVLSFQQIFTFRSRNGGIQKLVILENVSNNEAKLSYNDISTEEQAVANALIGTASPVLARDNGFLASMNFMSGGQNEKVWRIRNR